MSKEQKTEGKAVIHIDSSVENGAYSNAANVIHSPHEFILDFALFLPGDRRKVVSRIITSPAHAKQLAEALNRNVEKYEETYGVIEVGKGDIEPDFSGPVN